jgi:hypothetical protein
MSLDVVDRPLGRRGSRAGALVLLALAMGLLGFGAWIRGLPAFVAWQVSRDHPHGLGDRPGVHIWSSEATAVSAWLEQHGTVVPPLPEHAGSAGLVGARYCSLVDRVAAHVVYQGENTSVSIFVLHGPLRAPSGWSASVRGLHVHFVRAAGRMLAVVGENENAALSAVRAFATSVARAPVERFFGAQPPAVLVDPPPPS